jgi:hypothetical protein
LDGYNQPIFLTKLIKAAIYKFNLKAFSFLDGYNQPIFYRIGLIKFPEKIWVYSNSQIQSYKSFCHISHLAWLSLFLVFGLKSGLNNNMLGYPHNQNIINVFLIN